MGTFCVPRTEAMNPDDRDPSLVGPLTAMLAGLLFYVLLLLMLWG